MDQDTTPVLDAIEEIRQAGTYTFSLPGHRYGRGVDDRTAEVLSYRAFAADVMLAKSAVSDAKALYADAVVPSGRSSPPVAPVSPSTRPCSP
jgi:arginine decarboxylase